VLLGSTSSDVTGQLTLSTVPSGCLSSISSLPLRQLALLLVSSVASPPSKLAHGLDSQGLYAYQPIFYSAQCSKATTTINSQAEATALGNACSKYKGSIVIGTQTDTPFNFPGIEEITGDLTLLNNALITGFSVNELTTVGGTLTLQNLTLLTSFTATVLTSVDKLHLQSLPALGSLTIGPPGITKANEVIVSDTFLEALSGIDVRDVKQMDINNNRRLKDFTTALRTVSGTLKISANNKLMAVTMNSLQWIQNMEIANVTTFEATALNVVNESAHFDFNYFEKFVAPNLTHTEEGDISFVGNSELQNITLTSLSAIGGGFTIANNTALKVVTGFPKLKTITGALKMKGNFTE